MQVGSVTSCSPLVSWYFILEGFLWKLPRPHSVYLTTFSGWLCEKHVVTTWVPTDDDSEKTTCSSLEQEPENTGRGL